MEKDNNDNMRIAKRERWVKERNSEAKPQIWEIAKKSTLFSTIEHTCARAEHRPGVRFVMLNAVKQLAGAARYFVGAQHDALAPYFGPPAPVVPL